MQSIEQNCFQVHSHIYEMVLLTVQTYWPSFIQNFHLTTTFCFLNTVLLFVNMFSGYHLHTTSLSKVYNQIILVYYSFIDGDYIAQFDTFKNAQLGGNNKFMLLYDQPLLFFQNLSVSWETHLTSITSHVFSFPGCSNSIVLSFSVICLSGRHLWLWAHPSFTIFRTGLHYCKHEMKCSVCRLI